MYTRNNHASRKISDRHRSESSSGTSTRHERVNAAHRALDEHLHELAAEMSRGKSDRLIAYLNFTVKLHGYSASNLLLIWAQRPDATHVAGLKTWNSLGRRVRQGERGLLVFAPVKYKREAGNRVEQHGDEVDRVREEIEVTSFRAVYIFDVAQTEGQPVPTLLDAEGDASLVLPAIRLLIRKRGIDLIENRDNELPPGAAGAPFGGQIIIRSNLVDAEAFRTLAHEMLHHDGTPRPDRRVRENRGRRRRFRRLSPFRNSV